MRAKALIMAAVLVVATASGAAYVGNTVIQDIQTQTDWQDAINDGASVNYSTTTEDELELQSGADVYTSNTAVNVSDFYVEVQVDGEKSAGDVTVNVLDSNSQLIDSTTVGVGSTGEINLTDYSDSEYQLQFQPAGNTPAYVEYATVSYDSDTTDDTTEEADPMDFLMELVPWLVMLGIIVALFDML